MSENPTLVLTRKQGESLRIGDSVVTVKRVKGKQVILSTTAPRDVRVLRTELETEEPKE